MCRSKQAFTLMEMIVAAVIFLVIVGLFFFLLVPTLRNTGSRSARAELGQAAAVTMNRLGAALKSTVPGAIKAYPDTGFALTPMSDLSPDGRQQFAANLTVVVFDKPQRVLAIGQWAPATSPDPNVWIQAPPDLTVALTNRKQLTANVDEFAISCTPEGAVTSPVNLRMVLTKKDTTGDPERLEMNTTVCLRNSSN